MLCDILATMSHKWDPSCCNWTMSCDILATMSHKWVPTCRGLQGCNWANMIRFGCRMVYIYAVMIIDQRDSHANNRSWTHVFAEHDFNSLPIEPTFIADICALSIRPFNCILLYILYYYYYYYHYKFLHSIVYTLLLLLLLLLLL